MSIQASINAALGSIEGAIMTGAQPSGAAPAAKQPTATPSAEPSKKKPEGMETTAEAQNANLGHSGASADQVAGVILRGQDVAGAMANGRLAAALQIRRDTTRAAQDRLTQLREMKAAARNEVRGVKHQERILRRESEKKGGGV
ncbi:MAG: hypothetical protein J5547_05770 [Clostridia bacterium]|nr:hypothetical protein [Clostridia bacterium]